MYDTIIIGAGISGLTAAMYAARKRMKFEVISSDFGGQFMVSGEVLNYPGIIKTTGVDFLSVMEKQMELKDLVHQITLDDALQRQQVASGKGAKKKR